MPVVPDHWNLDSPESRFTLRPAIAILAGEDAMIDVETGRSGAGDVIRSQVGEWILDANPVLGTGRAEDSAVGRGASGWVPVVIWAASAAGAGVIGNAAWAAAARIVDRLRQERRARFYVSRGMAAALAADHVAREFKDAGPFTLEAAGEPSDFGGHPAHELNYVGIEPWIVLLRGAEHENRYTVVVEPDGRVSGVLRTPISEWDRSYHQGPIRIERPGGSDAA